MIADASRVSLLLLFATLALLAAFQTSSDLFFDFGPNDGRYVSGFREDFEVDDPTILHWSSDRASVRLPFYLWGPYDVTLRFKRHIASPAEVRLFLGDELVETVVVPQQDFGLITISTDNRDSGPFELRILSRSRDRRPLGIALDWMQIRPSARLGVALPTPRAMLWILSWVLAFYLVPRFVGLPRRWATLSGGLAALALTGLALAHKLWPVHASLTLGLRAHALTLLLIAFFLLRRRVKGSAFETPAARWALYAVFVGLAVRLFALFHPDFYYPDVRTHSKFVYLIWTEGIHGFFANYIDNQHTHLLGLQLVGSQWLAFPYPPLLYLGLYPLSRIQLPVEDWMKIMPTVLVAVEALVLFALARKLRAAPRVAVIAVLLHVSARVVAFRLAVASYAALFGHFWDFLVVLYLVVFFERMHRTRYALGFASLIAISILSYAGSALVLGLFVPAFCLASALAKRERRPPTKRLLAIAAWALVGALVAVASFYWQYVPEILTRPAAGMSASTGAKLIEVTLTPIAALEMSAYRLNLFYSVFGFLAIGGLVVLRKKLGHPLAAPLAAAALATFVGLNFLRAGLGATHIFQFSKDDLVVLPLVTLALALLVDGWYASKRTRVLAVLVVVGWTAWGVVRFAADIRSRFIRPDYPPVPSATGSAPSAMERGSPRF